MRRKTLRIVPIVAALAVIGVMALTQVGSSAGASVAAHGKGRAVTHRFTKQQQGAALRYWTPARMAAAKDVSSVTLAGAPAASGPAHVIPTGTPSAVAGSAPSGAAAVPARVQSGSVGPDTQYFSYPFPYTRFQVSPTKLWKQYPYAVNGKVFFTNDGGNYVCSGTSVASPDGREVWTAGHCVSNTDGTHLFDSSFVFVPAYNGNVSKFDPKGEWASDSLTTWSLWINNGDFSYDNGAAHMALDSKGRTLASRVGTDGFAWNYGRVQDFVDFGYPQASPFNGANLIECNAATAIDDIGQGTNPNAPIGIGCDMTGGSSGGSWNISWGGGGPGYINGHNDYKYSDQPLAMYSPYQDTNTNTVRCSFYAPGSGAGC